MLTVACVPFAMPMRACRCARWTCDGSAWCASGQRPEPCADCAAASTAIAAASANSSTCLCLFDIDRTLTAKQWGSDHCPGVVQHPGIQDWAYGGGTFHTSALAGNLGATFCHKCFFGVLTAGDASGATSAEATLLWSTLRSLPQGGSLPAVESQAYTEAGAAKAGQLAPLILHAGDGVKQNSVDVITRWYHEHAGVSFAKDRVYFFDDKAVNVRGFYGTGFNARQISCASRDGELGLCGGTPEEVVDTPGVHLC